MQKIRFVKSVTSISGRKVNIFYKMYEAGIIITENAILVNTVKTYFIIFLCLMFYQINYQFSSRYNLQILKGIDDFLLSTTTKALPTTIVTTGMI